MLCISVPTPVQKWSRPQGGQVHYADAAAGASNDAGASNVMRAHQMMRAVFSSLKVWLEINSCIFKRLTLR